ncbi:MAG TPA: amidohydrolase family protein [Pyrinomonadaceae bacterium]|nr:amidohydrolase family protein [Pyrinomonadaceae bacterium]
MKILLTIVLICVPGSVPVWAQQIGNPTTQQGVIPARGTFAIRNARIVTVSGADIENGTVVIRDGKIEAVGTNVNVPAGAQSIDGRGLSVYPGMIDAGTNMGLVEVPQGANGTVDTSEVGEFNPNAKAIIAVNPHSAHIAVTRVEGITNTLTAPTGGLISGQAALINLLGTAPKEMAVVPQFALVINYPRVGFGGGGFGGFAQAPPNLAETLTANERQVEQIRKMLRDAEAYGRAQEAYEKDKTLPRPDHSVVLEPLVPYVRGERPVIFRADREAEIRGAIKFAEEMKLKAIILGGNDAWRVASLLKEKNVPVILTGIFSLPSREDDDYDVLYENAAKLQQAGVRFAISTGDAGPEVRNLAQYAGMAAAYGLSKADAVKAVTLYPAQIMNVADRLGSIEAGKMANLVVTDGDLLEIRTHIRYLFIDGRPVVLSSRHTELNDAFKNRK